MLGNKLTCFLACLLLTDYTGFACCPLVWYQAVYRSVKQCGGVPVRVSLAKAGGRSLTGSRLVAASPDGSYDAARHFQDLDAS
ncbi:hypothetical protein [Dechloromonas denitrificans]|uniref:hypothetical protein n=1 Tax=Dechloromonas denitrificans TaxID=281362 RepID=UPI001CF8592D|nr:hypothetical protein [Dechloromonas denitrificans]UCV03503.1 hypothetical protein KI611_21000 [Dechloromonas denitrificans]